MGEFFSRVLEFFWAIAGYWWTLVPGGVLVIVPIVEEALPEKWKRVVDSWWPKERRPRDIRRSAYGAFLVAAFLAWNDAHKKNQELERQIGGRQNLGVQLTADQRVRLKEGLRLPVGENYIIQVNSANNCETCEDLALELRELIGSIPGWKTSGGGLIWDNPYKRGSYLSARVADKESEWVKKLLTAFSSAGMPLTPDFHDAPPSKDYLAIVIVGRRR